MATHTFYVAAFTLTVIIAIFSIAISLTVYLKGKREYLHVTNALLALFGALFIISGFVEKIFDAPSDSFTLFACQWSYATGFIAFLFYFLFVLGLYLKRAPRKTFLIGSALLGVLGVVLSFSPLFMTSAHYDEGTLTFARGPLYSIVPALTLLFVTACIVMAYSGLRKSSGIDRARFNLIFLGLLAFIPFPLVFSYILPAVTGNATYSNYTFLASIIIVCSTSYTLIRLRLLDLRIILRKTGLFLTFIFILAAPLVLLSIPLTTSNLSSSKITVSIFAVSLALLGIAPFFWKWLEGFSSRLFFSGLYDSNSLKRLVEGKISSSPDPAKSIRLALEELTAPLNLERLSAFILPGVLARHSIRYEAKQEGAGISLSSGSDLTDLEDLSKTPETVVTEELQRWPRNEEEEKLAQTLNERRITACIPLKAGDKLLGYFLLGEKIGKHVITSTDIACLEDIGTSLALYIDNYRLSNQLKGRLEELETVYEQLQKADEFKTEIINVTSHELRTPLTILSAFTQLLLEKYSRLDEGERNEYLLHIKEACERLESVVRQFLNVSSLQQGAVVSDIQSLSLVELLNRVKAHYGVEEQNRIKIECPDDRMTVLSDDFYLSEMLKNLTENALRFGPQDESVLIRAEPKGEMVKISIEDSGDGIHIDEAEEIFNAFTRLEDLDKHHSGIGLGLYTVRLIADLLETQVKVSSAAKGGASFSFDVPAGNRD